MEKEQTHDLKHITSSVKCGGANVMEWAYMAVSGTETSVFNYVVIAD